MTTTETEHILAELRKLMPDLSDDTEVAITARMAWVVGVRQAIEVVAGRTSAILKMENTCEGATRSLVQMTVAAIDASLALPWKPEEPTEGKTNNHD